MANSGLRRSMSSSPAGRIVVLLPLVLIVDLMVVLGLGLLPLESISGLRCESVLDGGAPKPDPKLAAPIAASKEQKCSDAASGRTVAMVVVGVLLLILEAGAVFAPADRLERFLVSSADDDEGYEPYQAGGYEAAQEGRRREERMLGDARRAAQARALEERRLAVSERREARVAQARAARLKARAEAPVKPAKKVSKATKKAAGPAKKVRATKVAAGPVKKVRATKVAAGPAKKVRATKVAAGPVKKASRVTKKGVSTDTPPVQVTEAAPAARVVEVATRRAGPRVTTRSTKRARTQVVKPIEAASDGAADGG